MDCPVCASSSVRSLSNPRRSFFRCGECGFSWAAERPDAAACRERYLLHRNDAGDAGYVGYLSGVIDAALSIAQSVSGVPVRSVVDWGSGPNPVCASLLRERGLEVAIWDPLFAAGDAPACDRYDLALCIEVVEHFSDPVGDFLDFASRIRAGGFAAVHTHIAPEDDADFLRWWYVEDPTHISFHSARSLRLLARRASLRPQPAPSGHLAIFSRPLPVLVAGGANLDAEGRPFAPLITSDSNPGLVRFSPGGAGRNVAEDLARLGIAVELVATVGRDQAGNELAERTAAAGVGISGMLRAEGEATSSYLSILDHGGDMALALSSMGIYERFSPGPALEGCERAAQASRARSFTVPSSAPFSAIVLDGNLLPATIEALLDRLNGIPAWFDPVSTTKARRLADWKSGALVGRFAALKPNRAEAEAMEETLAVSGGMPPSCVRYLSLGPSGVRATHGDREFHFVPPPVAVVSATGAGDAFLAGALRAILLGDSIEESVVQGCAASCLALCSPESCPPELTAARIEDVVALWRRSSSVSGIRMETNE